MLAALPYCNFKSYCATTKLYLVLIYQLADCLKHIYLKATNNQYAFKQYTPMLLQLYMLLTSNVLLLNAELSLNNGLPKDLQVGFLHYNFLKLKYKSHRIIYVNSIAIAALLCNSKIYFVTLK